MPVSKWVQDCSAAMQNLMLAAHDQGLGAVWTGVHPVEERVARFRTIFKRPEQVVPLGFAVIGWPVKPGRRKERYQTERIHHIGQSRRQAVTFPVVDRWHFRFQHGRQVIPVKQIMFLGFMKTAGLEDR